MRSKKVTPTKTELYFYTGNKLFYITDGTKKLKYYFVRDLSGKLLQMIDYTGATPKAYIYILDIHGNVIGLSDDTGILVNYEYDAWGNIINIPQSAPITGNGEPLANANPFRYCGYQFDGETGFYYLKYRYYYPAIGRFLTKDPMMSYNRYMYCRNNPVNFVDPLGLIDAMEGESSASAKGDPKKPISFIKSVQGTLTSPSTAFGATTSLSQYIFEELEKSAIKAIRNQIFDASIGTGMRLKIIKQEIVEATVAFSGANKAINVLGDVAGPIIDVGLGIYSLNQDKMKYSGSDLNRAQAVTYVATIAAVGVGFVIASASFPILTTLGLVTISSILIDRLAMTVKQEITKD